MAVDPFFGSVLAAGSNLIGGLIGGGTQRKANENARDAHLENLARQDEYARHGLLIRARDAMNAYTHTGIHPLALLGVSGPTYTPSSPAFLGGNAVGESIGRAGQDISRGLHATADRDLRAASLKLQEAAMSSQAERGHLENELLKIRIQSERMRLVQQSAPAMPSPSQGWALPGQIPDTTRLHMGLNAQPTFENMTRSGVGHIKMPDGSLMPVKSKEAQDVLEDDWFGNAMHWLQRSIGPSFGQRDPGIAADPGMRWTVNFWGNWVQVPKSAPFKKRGLGISNSGYGTYRR